MIISLREENKFVQEKIFFEIGEIITFLLLL